MGAERERERGLNKRQQGTDGSCSAAALTHLPLQPCFCIIIRRTV